MLTGVLLTLVATYKEYKTLQVQMQQIFELELDNIQKSILDRIDLHEHALKQTRAFFLNSDVVTREEFTNYVKDTELIKNYPGILGVGFSKTISPAQLKEHTAEIRNSGIRDYSIWPMYSREIYNSILYQVPWDGKIKNALGHDMFTNPIKKEAMERARDEGNTIITRKLHLAPELTGEMDKEPALLLFVPLYIPKTKIDTVANRRQNLRGYIYSIFRVKELFGTIFEESNLKVDFEIFDSPDFSAQSLVYDYDNIPHYNQIEKSAFHASRTINTYGQKFILFGTASSQFMAQMKTGHLWVLAGGLILTFLLTWLLVTIKKQEQESKNRVVDLQIMQNDLLETQNELHKAIEARDDFLSIASHELKNPLTSMKLHGQVLIRQLKSAPDLNNHREKIEKAVSKIEEQITSLNRLIEDMLDISRLRTGKLKIITEQFDLTELIKETLSNLEEQIHNAGYPIPIIEASGNFTGNWDKMRLGQVLYNLLINAIRYGNKKPIKIQIQDTGKLVRVAIVDQGIGISKTDQQRIFNRFERATKSNESSGLGLGLYISMHIILAHKGKIWVESEEGKGAAFIFEIPK